MVQLDADIEDLADLVLRSAWTQLSVNVVDIHRDIELSMDDVRSVIEWIQTNRPIAWDTVYDRIEKQLYPQRDLDSGTPADYRGGVQDTDINMPPGPGARS